MRRCDSFTVRYMYPIGYRQNYNRLYTEETYFLKLILYFNFFKAIYRADIAYRLKTAGILARNNI